MRQFDSVEDAWFAVMGTIRARAEGRLSPSRADFHFPETVTSVLDQLAQAKTLSLGHVRVLRAWGERQCPPQPHNEGELVKSKLWKEAMEALTLPLRDKGIVK